MQTNQKNTIVAFHIGRGGRFYNAGHRTYIGQKNADGLITMNFDNLNAGYENESQVLANLPNSIDERSVLNMFTNEDLDGLNAIGITAEQLGAHGYKDANGNWIISDKEVESGIVRLEFDGEYDTDYCKNLSNCNIDELKLIAKDNPDLIEEYFNARFDVIVVETDEEFTIGSHTFDNGETKIEAIIEFISFNI